MPYPTENKLVIANRIKKKKLKEKTFVVVDINSGRSIIDEDGHEFYYFEQNKIDNRYYNYCPPHAGVKKVKDVETVTDKLFNAFNAFDVFDRLKQPF